MTGAGGSACGCGLGCEPGLLRGCGCSTGRCACEHCCPAQPAGPPVTGVPHRNARIISDRDARPAVEHTARSSDPRPRRRRRSRSSTRQQRSPTFSRSTRSGSRTRATCVRRPSVDRSSSWRTWSATARARGWRRRSTSPSRWTPDTGDWCRPAPARRAFPPLASCPSPSRRRPDSRRGPSGTSSGPG